MIQNLPDQNQHYIPESYLKEFTKEGKGIFYELTLKTKKVLERHTRNVCCRTNFYDIDDEKLLLRHNIENPRHLETSFTYENTLRKILKKIRIKESPYLNLREFRTIVEAYSSIKHRTPYFRKKMGDPKLIEDSVNAVIPQVKEELKELISFTTKKDSNFNFDEIAETFRKSTLTDKNHSIHTHLSGLVEYSFNQNQAVTDAINKILTMNIIIVEAQDKDFFFTSDNPGYSINGNEVHNTNYGWFDKINFPINSKQMILFAGFNPSNYFNDLIKLNYVTIDSNSVNEVNRLTTIIADEKVYCEDRDYLVKSK